MQTFAWLFSRGILPLFISVMTAYTERAATSHFLPFMLRGEVIAQSDASIVLAAFGFGYVVGLPFSGYMIRRVGYSRLLALLSIGWFAASLMFPLCETYQALAATRFALGIFVAPLFPLFVSWITLSTDTSKRPKLIAVVEGSSYVGMAIVGPLAVAMATDFGWRVGYALVGTMALLALVASRFLEDPHVPRKSVETCAPLTRGQVSLAFAIALGFFMYNMAKSFYSTWFPTVLTQQWGFSSAAAAALTFTQNIAAPLASLALASISARLLLKGWSLPMARLVPFSVGFTLAALAWVPLLFPKALSVFAVVSFVGLIATSALIWNSMADLFPTTEVAHIAGYVNAFANIGTFTSPLVVGALIGRAPSLVFVAISALAIIALVCFFVAYGVLRSPSPTSTNEVAAR